MGNCANRLCVSLWSLLGRSSACVFLEASVGRIPLESRLYIPLDQEVKSRSMDHMLIYLRLPLVRHCLRQNCVQQGAMYDLGSLGA